MTSDWYAATNSTDPHFFHPDEAPDLNPVRGGHRLCAGPSFITGGDEELLFAVDRYGQEPQAFGVATVTVEFPHRITRMEIA